MKKIIYLIMYPLDSLLEFRMFHSIQNKLASKWLIFLLSLVITLGIFYFIIVTK